MPEPQRERLPKYTTMSQVAWMSHLAGVASHPQKLGSREEKVGNQDVSCEP
jgi:hypothetical protein